MKYKIQTLGSSNSSEFKRGAPADYPRFAVGVKDDYVLSDQEVRDGWFLESESQYKTRYEANKIAFDAWESKVEEEYVITRGQFFSRLTMQEWAAIKSASASVPEVAYFWDNLVLLDEGIYGPPDGTTPERTKSQMAKGLLTQLFGEQRAAELLTKP